MTRAFIDASAWVALGRSRDQHVLRVRLHLRLLAAERASYVTTNWTLYEALAIAHREGWRTMNNLYRHALSLCEPIPVDAAIEATALQRTLGWRDKTASVVDHANLLVALEEGCDTIVSFDQDFVPLAAGAGIRLLA